MLAIVQDMLAILSPMKFTILILLLSTISYGCSGSKTYEEAKRLADTMEANPDYKSHQSEVLVPHFANNYSSVAKECFANTDDPDRSKFNMVLVITEDGSVEKIFRDKETNIGICIFKRLEQEKFPSPITAPYYLHIELSFTR